MTSGWQTVQLYEVLKQDTNYVTELEPKTYPKLSVKLYGKGVVLDAPTDGANVKMQRHQFAKSGQIILSEIWAKKGAIGIVPKEGEGALVTSHFFLFDVVETKTLREFVGLLLKRNYFAEALDAHARGTTGYAAVRPKQFLSLEIPLPPLDEQRRIVERVEALATRITKAQSLREEADKEVNVLLSRATTYALDEQAWEVQRLENVLKESPRNGFAPQSKVEGNGKRMLRINAVSSSPNRFVDLSAFNIVDVPEEKANPFYMQNNEVFVVRYNGDINRVAKAAIYKAKDDEKIIFPDKLIRLRANEEVILPDYLVFVLSSRKVRSQIEELGKTTAGNIGISGSNIKSFMIPVPPLDEQRRIVAYLDSVQARLASLRALQSATGEELSALLPSVLDKAFKGELLVRKSKPYFAYGSNMKIDRITASERAPSARMLGRAKILDKKLVFNKISTDGSGKGNVIDSPSSLVWGVLFEINERDIESLDHAERGYDKQDIAVIDESGNSIDAFTYISSKIDNNLKPYDWYLTLIIQGADENDLPKEYVDDLRKFESKPDTRKKK